MGCVLLIIVFRNGRRSMVNFVCRARYPLSRQAGVIISASVPRAARRKGEFAAEPQTAACGLVRG